MNKREKEELIRIINGNGYPLIREKNGFILNEVHIRELALLDACQIIESYYKNPKKTYYDYKNRAERPKIPEWVLQNYE